MNRRQKIIVSVTGIFLVLLLLAGLTYAYFLTRINGNTNTKSISVSTANLALVYEDGNATINAEKIMPGTILPEKQFTVTNIGNSTVDYSVYLEDIKNEFELKDDVEYRLSCMSNISDKECKGSISSFPDNNSKIVTNTIIKGEKQSYSLVIEYKETNLDQSVDMNKELYGKVQIYGTEKISLQFEIANSSEGDYGIIKSEPKKSYATLKGTIGKYNFVGLEYGAHTLTIYNKEDKVIGYSEIKVKSGESTNVIGNNITLPNTAEEVIISVNNITAGSIKLGTIKIYEKNNPFPIGTLAHKIVSNAQNVTEEEKKIRYAEFMEKPLTIPGNRIKLGYHNSAQELPQDVIITVSSNQQKKDLKYGTNYTIKNNQIFVENSKTCKYNEDNCIRDLLNNGENIYLTNNFGTQLGINGNNYQIYKLIEAPDPNDNATIDIIARELSISYSLENLLSIEEDNLGYSYYYRGDVTNNYINFAGMCWRIVRIEGDGSIKLILEDKNTTCNSETYTGDWSLGLYPYGSDSNGNNYLKPNNYSQVNAYKKFQTDILQNEIKNNYNTSELSDYLKFGNWCISDGYSNLNIGCNGTILDNFNDNSLMYVGGLTANEAIYGGIGVINNYLINNWFRVKNTPYDSYFNFRTLTYDKTSNALSISVKGTIVSNNSTKQFYIRPSIQLKNGIEILRGTGSIKDPYEISTH